jgi:cystathionine beta-synthase
MNRTGSSPWYEKTPNEEMNTVVEKMNRYDISQLPVIDDEGRLIGLVGEADILDHLLRSTHVHDPLEIIASIINPNVLTVRPDASIESVLPAFERGKVVVIIDAEGRPVGMLTKIDLIDYLTGKIG